MAKRIIAVSDSHGNAVSLRLAFLQAMSLGHIDAAVFLGDGYRDFIEMIPELSEHGAECHYVAGNNDFCTGLAQEETFVMGGARIYICHGHQWGIKYSNDRLYYAAEERGANVCFFGHTHIPFRDIEHGIWYVNPSAVSYPVPGRTAYAEVLIDEREIYVRNVPWADAFIQ